MSTELPYQRPQKAADGSGTPPHAVERNAAAGVMAGLRSAAAKLPPPLRHALRLGYKAAQRTAGYGTLTLRRLAARLAAPRPPRQQALFSGSCRPSWRHEDTYVALDQMIADRRFERPYRKTFDFAGDYIDDDHASLARAPTPNLMISIGIDGWLLPADALKLYEMGYCCGGDVLELGTYYGLSTSILARAATNSGRDFSLLSVDLSAAAIQKAKENLESFAIPGREHVSLMAGDAIQAVASLADQGRRFPFAFVDHSHRYEHMLPTCQRLHDVIVPGGFVLFHDYNDPRNPAPNDDDYGVFQGVHDGLKPGCFEFWGVYGCTGLFRRN